jgi:tight adherence protein B
MIGMSWAAVLLAAGVLALPSSPQRRLKVRRGRRIGRTPVVIAVLAAAFVAAASMAATTVLAAGVVAATLFIRFRRSLRRRRGADEGRALAAALEILVGELRIGAHPVRAFECAAKESTGAVGAALSGVAARARLGADVAAGLRVVASQSALAAEWDRVAVTWQMASEHGVAITAVMRTAQADIVERQRFWGRVQANMAGARATAVILAALPVVGVMLGELVGAAPVAFLTGGGTGGCFLVAGTVLLCCGLWWADRITDGLPA